MQLNTRWLEDYFYVTIKTSYQEKYTHWETYTFLKLHIDLGCSVIQLFVSIKVTICICHSKTCQ